MFGRMRVWVNALFVIFVFLAAPGMVWARTDDTPVEDWATEMRTLEEEVTPVPVVPRVILEEATPEPTVEYRCMGSQINNKIFWIPMECFDRSSLEQAAAAAGTSDLYCMHGYLTTRDEMAVGVAGAGSDGWPSCWDLVT